MGPGLERGCARRQTAVVAVVRVGDPPVRQFVTDVVKHPGHPVNCPAERANEDTTSRFLTTRACQTGEESEAQRIQRVVGPVVLVKNDAGLDSGVVLGDTLVVTNCFSQFPL